MANTEGYRLVRCPKCLNVLPEPANVTVYKCGGCGTTLRAKIRTGSGRHVAPKQVRQDSDSLSVATAVSNGVPPRNRDEASAGAAADGSCVVDASGTKHDNNGTRCHDENGDPQLQPAEKNAGVAQDTTEKKDHRSSEEHNNTHSSEECPADDLTRPNAIGTPLDHSGIAENPAAEEQCAENSDASEERGNDDSSVRRLDATTSENITLDSEKSKVVTVSIQGSEQKGTTGGESEHEGNRRSYLVRAPSRSCDLRASGNSLDFHSARTSLQSKSFRASEPLLQSKIMNSVDELKGDLTELFGTSKPSDRNNPRAVHPPAPRRKQDGYTSAPLAGGAGYRHAARHYSGHAATRLSMSGQVVAPRRRLPSPRYRRPRAYSGYPVVEQMERRPNCWHECCHSCRPPCYSYRPCSHEPATHKPPPVMVKEARRRPPPKHHCRPVLRGSPFVICSHCLKLVQLPTDFAVPSRGGTRRLRCGSCSETLSYSYRDPGRKKQQQLASPFGGDEYSMDDYDYDETHQAAADPVSYSEEHGLSFGASYSTSCTEDGQQQPLYVSRNSSFNTVEEAGAVVVARDGKLHRLMGYSSASELLRHSPDLFESFDGRTPEARARDRKGKGVVSEDSGQQVQDRHPVKRSKGRSGGLPLPLQVQGILKKGIHSLESLKLRS